MRRSLSLVVILLLLLAPFRDGLRSVFAQESAEQEIPQPPDFALAPDIEAFANQNLDAGVRASGPAEQGPQLPGLGAVLVDTPLTSEGVFGPVTCPTGRGSAQFQSDGYHLAVTGPCVQDQTFSAVPSAARGITFSDGQVEIQFKPLSDMLRASVFLYVRVDASNWYRLQWDPGTGNTILAKAQGATTTVLSRQTNLPPVRSNDASHTMAIRALGPQIWALIDGQAVLAATDAGLSSGNIRVDLGRQLPLTDSEEVSIVLQRLRITALAPGAQARPATAQQPAPAASPAPATGQAPAQEPRGAAPAQVPPASGR